MELWKGLLAVAAFLLAAICGHSQPSISAPFDSASATPTNQQFYDAKGVVQELDPDGKTVVIKHDAITGYMGAMTMPFVAKYPDELQGLRGGDAVTFRLVVTAKEGWIDHITKSGTVQVMDNSVPSFIHVVPDVNLLQVGEVLPNSRLTNELGQVINTSEFKGQALAFTFFFTRCPYPNFCPFLASSFADAQKRLEAMTNGPTNWHLLSVSFDPDNDTPATLKAYAVAHNYDPAHWTFATGALNDLTVLGDRFGEYFGHDDTGGVNHNLRTVIVDTHGRLQKVFIGNSWTSDQLVEEIVKAAKQ